MDFKKTIQVIAILGALLFASCNSGSDGSNEASASEDTATSIQSDSIRLSQPSDTLFFNLITNTDYIDIIFHTLPISISMDQTADIRRFFTFFDADPLVMPNDCDANATITFLKEGNILAESQLYFSTECRGLAFTEAQKPVSGVPLNLNGMRYFSNIIQQGRQLFDKNSRTSQ